MSDGSMARKQGRGEKNTITCFLSMVLSKKEKRKQTMESRTILT